MDLPQINPGELALATIGVSKILKGDMPHVGLGRLDEMASIPGKIERLASKVCLGTLTYTPYEHEHKYPTLLERLSKPLKPEELTGMLDEFPPEASDIAAGFSIAVQEALRDLKAVFPVSVYRTFAGPKNLEPNAARVGEFLNLLDVVNDPLRIFALIATGALLKSQAQIVRLVYPTFSAGVDAALYAASAKYRAASSESNPFQLPPRAEYGVKTWMGQRRVGFKPPTPPQPPPQAMSRLAQLTETAAQKATNPTLK
jgi:hypothetical protein